MNEHGGSSNAFTASEHTNYFFDVNCDHLEGALDRFAQFFINPLFLEGCTEREMQAVDSEHSKNILRDNWRLSQLEKHLANPEHPYHKFSTGNLKTLGEDPKKKGIDIRNTLIEFHSRWYSANLMSLVVLGKESLDELQEYVVRMFSAVRNKDVSFPDWKTLPWTDEQRGTFIRAKTIKDSRLLYLCWLCPDQKKHFLVKAQKYFSHLIGHEGQGSILNLLKEHGWATSLSAGCDDDSSGYNFFEVTIELSSMGLDHYKEIIYIVFEYIDLITEGGPNEQVFDECHRLGDIGFRFKDTDDPSSFAYKTARNLHRYPPKYILSGPYVQEQFDESVITEFADSLTRDNVRVILGTKDDENHNGKWRKETWYGTEFYVQPLSEHIKKFEAKALNLPGPNEFIPENFDVINKPALETKVKAPCLIVDKDMKIWHKIDDTFECPKANVRILFRTDVVTSSIDDAVGLHLFVELLKHKLTPILYPADIAGFSYDMSIQNEGLELRLSGFSERLSLVLDVILRTAENLTVSTESFDMIKERYEKQLLNLEHEQPYWHCSYILNGILQKKVWWYWDRLEALKNASLIASLDCGKKVFETCFPEVLVHGNVQDVQEYSEIVKKFTTKQTKHSYEQFSALQVESKQVFVPPKQLADPNSAIELFIQTCNVNDSPLRTLTLVFIQMFGESFFDILRTKEQLGYIVFLGKREKYDTMGLRFVIQSTKGDPEFLYSRIRAYFDTLLDHLDQMSEDSFIDIKKALIGKLREKESRLSQETDLYWEQIVPQRYDFKQRETSAQLLEYSLFTKASLYDFTKTIVLDETNKLIVQAWPSNIGQPSKISQSIPARIQ